MPLVSVIMPYYKKKDFIKESISSAINQSYQNLEIYIIFNDDDINELNFVKDLEKLDKRIKLIISKSAIGAGSSRNFGIDMCNGKYVAFLDCDDIWDKDKIKKQIEFLEEKSLNCCHTSYNIIDKHGKIIGTRKARTFLKLEELLKSCDIGLSTVLIKKELLKDDCVFATLKTKEDFVLWLNLLKKGYKIEAIDITLASWRKLENSLSSSTIQKLFDGFRVYRNYMKFNFFLSIYYLICLSLNYLRK